MKSFKSVNYLFLSLFLLLLLGSTALATNVEINGQTQDKVSEGQVINYTLTINNISPAADYISFDTDLVKIDNSHLYNITNLNVTSDSNKFDFPVNESTTKIVVNIKGQIPHISEEKQYDGVTLIKYKKNTGYAYDRITLINSKGDQIESVETRPFEISLPEVESFREQINKIDDPFFKTYLQDLHDKGLVTESKTLADHLTEDNEWPSYWWLIIGVIAGLIIGIIIGIRMNNSREVIE
ncbi:hypothetical protein FXW07_07825 [Methanosarcina sp. DH1]|uniref:hypothetical protein n=1 Tax=Methanosarcina sp. DH1 TaxID=2605695 RepID=UPI001E5D5C04|nr:hypothetical protein [Methanosarcina sp. DH1]MCC4766526.1 hypothetical protein [Methanosarcina sp. DH1]